jgi:UDP-2,3-diacylglucosamine pyrophosphatase LpxH
VHRLKRTLFISDLHLDDSRPGIVAQFERFMEGVVPGADALFILGDLFEYWVGDDGSSSRSRAAWPSRSPRARGASRCASCTATATSWWPSASRATPAWN